MKTLLSLVAGLCLITSTASAHDHHYTHHHGYVGHYHSGFSVLPRFGLSFGTAYADPYYTAPYCAEPYYEGPVYAAPIYPYYQPQVYVSRGRFYHGHSYHRGGSFHRYHR